MQRVQSVVADHPDEARAYLLRGEAHLTLHQHGRATADFQRAKDIDNSAEASLALLRAYRASDQTAHLMPVIEAYYADGGNDPRLRSAEADLFIAGENWTAAVAVLEALVTDYPNAAPALNNAAYALHKLGRTERALNYARRAQALAPNNPSVNDTLGWLLVESGQPEAGLGFLREATARAANNPELQYHLAATLSRLGRSEEARLVLLKALRDGSAFGDAEVARALLAALEAGN